MGTSFTSPPATGKPRIEWGQAMFAPNPYVPLLYHLIFSLHCGNGLLCSLVPGENFFFLLLFFVWVAFQLSGDTIKLIRAKILPYASMVCTNTLFTATSQRSVWIKPQKVKHWESLTSTAGFMHMGTRKPGTSVNQGCPFDTMSLLQYFFLLVLRKMSTDMNLISSTTQGGGVYTRVQQLDQ